MSAMRQSLVCVWMVSLLSACAGYRFLVVFPMPSGSHSILGRGVVRALLDAGHEVTYMTPFPLPAEPRLQQLDLSFAISLLWSQNPLNIRDVLDSKRRIDDPSEFMERLNTLHSEVVANETVQKFLLDPEQEFDVVLIEWLFSEHLIGLSAVFNCPYVWVSSLEPHWAVLRLIDQITNPAYVPSCMTNNMPPMTFVERVQELWTQIMVHFFMDIYWLQAHEDSYEKMFRPLVTARGRELPPYEALKYNASMILGNSHVSLGQATPLPQSYKPVGGYHIDLDVKLLAEDLKSLMDNAKNGVIYFSMGSNLKSQDFPDELKQNLLKMFGQLKQTIIWKFEDILPNLPKNVHILKWAPQPSILAHPNCVLFITHGGLLSTTEAVHFGVPIIGIPVFADQFMNVERSVKRGFARKVDLSYQMPDDLKAAISDIINNPSYSQRVKELSAIYHDRPVSPRRELAHWAAHVVRSHGAPHLRSPALQLPWYQKLYLDLLLLVLAVTATIVIAIRRLCTSIKRISRKKKVQ